MKLSLTLFAASAAAASVIVACANSDERIAFEPLSPPAADFTTGDGGLSTIEAGDGGEPCLTDTLGAEPVPLAMLLVMDRSGSMAGTKWDQARYAMIGFADTPGAAGSKLGLTVFPPDPGGGDQCTPASYKPIVPIALLPGNGTAIKDALLSRSTTGSTPMAGGLQGGVDSMKDFLGQNPNEEGVIILVTDGDPGACSGDTVSNVATIASSAAKGTPRIRTFVVGMEGATFSNLDTIAKAGEGAPTAFNAANTTASDGGVSAQQQLLDALEKIRSGALGCEYILPTPSGDKGVLDPNSVEIEFTPGGNDPPERFKRVDSAEQCGTKTGGFYYDDPKNPKRIILCPASCTDVKEGTSTAKVDVFLGCIKPVK
jgi:hypothetical protein